MIKRSDFNFELDDHSIAKYPLKNRQDSKLLVHKNGENAICQFSDVVDHLDGDTLLVMNNARVIPARLYFKRETGALIEVLLLEPIVPSSYEKSFSSTKSCQWKCIIGNSKKWKDDEAVFFHNDKTLLQARLIDRSSRIVELSWSNGEAFTDLIERIGELPLPPYLNRATEASDANTYQTVFAKRDGSVAAPTAGLHFTAEVFEKLDSRGVQRSEVTLHVGAGTFLPVKADNVEDHDMHCEHFEIELDVVLQLMKSPKRVCVGTTSLRVLESLYWIGVRLSNGYTSLAVDKLEPYETETSLSYVESLKFIVDYLQSKGLSTMQASTSILILPHYKVRSIEALITNFHLPESTLLMLISSVVGDAWRDIYQTAIDSDFRFLSYGDSSLLWLREE